MKLRNLRATLLALAVMGLMMVNAQPPAVDMAENLLNSLMGGGGPPMGDNTLEGGPGPDLPGMPASGGITQFTVADVNQMIKDMNNSIRYNYQGQVASEGEVTFTTAELQRLLLLLQMQDASGSFGASAGGNVDFGAGVGGGAGLDFGGDANLGAGGDFDMGAGVNLGASGGVDMGADSGVGGDIGLDTAGGALLGAGGNVDSGIDTEAGGIFGLGAGVDVGATGDIPLPILDGGFTAGGSASTDMGAETGSDLGINTAATGDISMPNLDSGLNAGVTGNGDMSVDGNVAIVTSGSIDGSVDMGAVAASDLGVDTGAAGHMGMPDLTFDGGLNVGAGASADMGEGASADMGAGASADMGAGASADMGAGASADMGAGVSADLGADASADLGAGASTDMGAGASADMSADASTNLDIGASADLGSGASANVDADASAGLDASASLGAGASANIDTGATADMGGDAGADLGTDLNAGLGTGVSAGLGVDGGSDLGLAGSTDIGAGAGGSVGMGPSDSVDMGITGGVDMGADVNADMGLGMGPDGGVETGTGDIPFQDFNVGGEFSAGAGASADIDAGAGADIGASGIANLGLTGSEDIGVGGFAEIGAGGGVDTSSDAGPAPDAGADAGTAPAGGQDSAPPADGQGGPPADGTGPPSDTGAGGQGAPFTDNQPTVDDQSPPAVSGQGDASPSGGIPPVGVRGPDDVGPAPVSPPDPPVPTRPETVGAGPPKGMIPPDMMPNVGKDENMVDINPVVGDLPLGAGDMSPKTPKGPQQPFGNGDPAGPMGPEWLKARIDPAACREWRCNLPICYVPYPNDCKSYIVCQRTALGNYVAWRMRCAFGSYWGTGTLWTCERVEDLASQGYTCPNDPCQNPALKTYADPDDKNCRTYWRCEGGVSRPTCCPQGTRFDTASLSCVADPKEVCRSPCPLKIEGCSLPGARTQPFYDGNCRTYWDCENGHPHPVCCGTGMTYEASSGGCVNAPGCTDTCPSEYGGDICGKLTGDGTPVKSYDLTDGNCRTFMKCNPKGYDDAFCCRQEHFYNAVTGQCELVEDPLDPCITAACPRTYKEECRFTSVDGFPKRFYDTDAGLERDCAPGTAFVEDICTCDGNSVAETCKKEVWAKFNELNSKWSVKNYGDGFISVFGGMTKNQSADGITYGAFDGSSGMEVWRYDHAALPEVTLRITFQPVQGGSNKQILISNCGSVNNKDRASFEVTVNPDTSMIEFTGKTNFDTAVLAVRYNKQGWNTFTLLYDGQNVLAKIEDPAALGQADQTVASLRGDIEAGLGALKFGPCLDRNSQPETNGFTGFVSEAIFSKCVDKDSKDDIRMVLSNGNGAGRGAPPP